jgi:hypothetical protein
LPEGLTVVGLGKVDSGKIEPQNEFDGKFVQSLLGDIYHPSMADGTSAPFV